MLVKQLLNYLSPSKLGLAIMSTLFFYSVSYAQWGGSGSTSGDVWRSGDVRLGANGSAFSGVKLQVEGGDFLLNSATGSLDIRHFGTNEGWTFNTINAGEDFQILADPAIGSTTRRFVIRQGGDVGFNIFPSAGFDFYHPTASVNTLRLQGGRPGIFTPSRLEFWSDPRGSGTEWRPALMQSLDQGNFTGGLVFYTNGAGASQRTATREVMRLVNGKVGINNASPNYALHVQGESTTGIQYDGPTNGFAGYYANGGLPFYGYKQGNSIKGYHYVDTQQNFRLWLNGTNRLSLTNQGELGVGVTEPLYELHVKDGDDENTAATLFVQPAEWNSVGDFGEVRIGDPFHYWRGEYGNGSTIYDYDKIRFRVGGANALIRKYIAFNVNVGISTSNPTARFHNVGSVRLEKLPSGGGQPLLIDAQGNVYRGSGSASASVSPSSEVTELKAEIEELKARLAQLEGGAIKTPGLNTADVSEAQLFQNQPNPFNERTQIKMHLPESVQQATLQIYDMQGRPLKRIPVTQRGDTAVDIAANTLRPGMYLYALIADNQEIDVKRMILQ